VEKANKKIENLKLSKEYITNMFREEVEKYKSEVSGATDRFEVLLLRATW